jgi:RNA polymerase-binding transcription factor DksA
MSIEDRAQELELRDWERNNRPRNEQKRFEPNQKGYGTSHCLDCGDEMPLLRRAMGKNMCTDCTSAEERKSMQWAPA